MDYESKTAISYWEEKGFNQLLPTRSTNSLNISNKRNLKRPEFWFLLGSFYLRNFGN